MGIRIASETRPVQVSGSSQEGRTRCRLARNELIPGSRYELKRWIGEGGMGVIYEAEHVDVKRRVAVKVLRPEYATDLDIINAFRFEARATSELDSPHLVKIYDFFELPDGRSALVMELLEGHDLSRRDVAVVPVSRVVSIARQVCKALQIVHEGGLVHRDLKPENIFLCNNEERPDTVRVLDFGIARLASQAISAQSGGTPLYTPPEVVLGGAQGPAADIYALGCVVYELLTGETAFGRENVDATLRAHLEDTPPAPSTLDLGVPKAFDSVVSRALAKDPKDRFESMATFEAALCEAQVATSITTSWDDLELPAEIPADQRARLAARMPDPTTGRPSIGRRKLWAAVFGSAMLTAAAAFAVTRPDATSEAAKSPELLQAESLARQARKAGSRAAWVYPPPDDVSGQTAYQAVLALEDMVEVGKPIARRLRADFALTLIRLGDEYWDADGGARFAVAYYEQALLFEPTSEHARERSTMSEGSLTAFADRAASSKFALEELIRVEPLIELAESVGEAPEVRVAKVKQRRRRAREAEAERDGTPSPPKDGLEEATVLEPAEAAPATADAQAPQATAEEQANERDPDAARDLSRQASSAAKAGNDTKARLLYDRALAKDPRNASAHAGLRDLAFYDGDYARAVRHGKRAASLAPRSATHQLRLGDAYYRTRRYDLAEKAYAAAAKLGDDRAKWRLERAQEKLGK